MGVAVTSHGVVWLASRSEAEHAVRFDPKSESFSAEPIPSGGGVVRNKVETPDGRLYLACSSVNKVAIVDAR